MDVIWIKIQTNLISYGDTIGGNMPMTYLMRVTDRVLTNIIHFTAIKQDINNSVNDAPEFLHDLDEFLEEALEI